MIDETHDPAALSWVDTANAHPEFPVQNLPFGMFAKGAEPFRPGVAIGDMILDLGAVLSAGLLAGGARVAAEAAVRGPRLNDLLALDSDLRRELRRALFALLTNRKSQAALSPLLCSAAECRMDLPATIGDYTDFYAGIHHATAVGSILRPDNPLPANYKYVPIGYHGRASSIRASGAKVHRPSGQAKGANESAPRFGRTHRLDFELELGIWIGAPSRLGEPIPIDRASEHIAGFSLLNDWSARDIQTWEYQPLGPFLAKNFLTSISPWIVTVEALAPFRVAQPARPAGDPPPLPYLYDAGDQAAGALDITLGVQIRTASMRARGEAPQQIGRTSTNNLYWTPAQLVAHHTCSGCNLNAGDLMGTGTISGTEQDARGSLMEMTSAGARPITLRDSEARSFLEDGDEIILTAHAAREGFATIGFGTCQGVIV